MSALWSEFELQVLYELVNRDEWYAKAKNELPGRSENAIRVKMGALRREAGIVPKPGPSARSSSFMLRQRAIDGSEQLRRAIEHIAA